MRYLDQGYSRAYCESMNNYISGNAVLNRFSAMVEVSIDRPLPARAWYALARRAAATRYQATNPLVISELTGVIHEAQRCAADSAMDGQS